MPNDEILLINCSDSGSGVKRVEIYEKNNLYTSTNMSIFSLSLPTRSIPYIIYYTVIDNVGNVFPLQLFDAIDTDKENAYKDCSSNCLNNGNCTEHGICVCC